MAEEVKRSKDEIIKENSRQLRGPIAEELKNDAPELSDEAAKLLKYHGSYQQDNRDSRRAKNPDGTPKGKEHIFMVRTRVPGGKVTAEQFLAELDLCEKYGYGTLRITTRQGFQIHGVIKQNLKATIRGINDTLLTTLAACGDVERNVICCPAPHKHTRVHDELQKTCDALAAHLKPRTTAYYEIWLTDENGEKRNVAEFQPVDEPIYGKTYLPRKFKTAVGLPGDNCIDIYANDLGLLAVVENDQIIGFNVLVGGSMGQTPSAEKTFPAVAKRMAFITPDQVLSVAESIVKVQRDYGNRADRKLARMKYLIANWGLETFKAKVEEYYGRQLPPPHPVDVTDVDDHLGWREQGDGNWYLGINVENGRIQDADGVRMKSGLRAILQKYGMRTRLTTLQSALLCDIHPEQRDEINHLLAEYGIQRAEEMTPTRRFAIACPAMPTCGLAVTESERIFPGLLTEFEVELKRQGLENERISIHMTGCPNGCARPYTPDIGFVGKTLGKYTIYLGGNAQGTRLAFLYRDLVPLREIVPTLGPIFAYYKAEREDGESFGDFCLRKGHADLEAYAIRMSDPKNLDLPRNLATISTDQLVALAKMHWIDMTADQQAAIRREAERRLADPPSQNGLASELRDVLTAVVQEERRIPKDETLMEDGLGL